MLRTFARTTFLAALASSGCYSGRSAAGGDAAADGGETASSGDGSSTVGDGPSPSEADEVAISGLRRLSIAEYRQTVLDLLGVTIDDAVSLLPPDTLAPFDNDYTLQLPSEPLVKGLELVAGDIAEAVVADEALRTAATGCELSGTDDTACFRSFVTSFGRRALRRPLTDDEIDRFAALQSFADDSDDIWVAVSAVLRAFLQHPEFVYRVEIGTPVDGEPGLFRLGAYETSTRLSYLLLGTTPPDWLLDAAQAGDLDHADGIVSAASTLLADDRARARIRRFHALWLSYSTLSRTGVFGDMHEETEALIDLVVFDDRSPWVEMLTSTDTFLTPALADHYGLPAPAGNAAWVDYGDSGRMGLLSHGAFLSVGAKFGDTSPTQRGKLVRTRFLCEDIPKPPPDLMVDVDTPPVGADPDACKRERYYMSTEQACSSCHALMDLIGFGLEAYDATGVVRATDIGRPDCPISGDGDVVGVGTFNGPAELAGLLLDSGKVESCVARQVYRFAIGRNQLDEHDVALIDRLVSEGGDSFELFGFVANYVASEAFRHRREETP